MTMLDAVMDELQRELESPEVQQVIQARLETWIDRIGTTFRDRVLPSLIKQTDNYLNNEANWQQIEETLIRALQWTKQQALSALNSDAGQAWITRGIERAVHQLNVTNLVEQQVKGLDTDELEKWCSTTPAAISP